METSKTPLKKEARERNKKESWYRYEVVDASYY